MQRWKTCSLLALLATAAVSPAAANDTAANDTGESRQFLRVRRDAENQPIALETPVFRYVPKGDERQNVIVDLVGAIHVGDKAYYDRLNTLFTEYDAVLYELVAPPEARVPTTGRQRLNLLTSAQLMMKGLLDLEFQLDCVDYAQKNFVHADLSPAEFRSRMNERGESFVQMFFRLLSDSMTVQSKHPFAAGETAFLAALISKNRAYQLKRLLAKQFADNVAQPSSMDGPAGSTIISERNKRAMDVLAKQLRSGSNRIAIFYGAAHLRDMDKRLDTDFHFKRSRTTWITAWDLTLKTSRKTPSGQPSTSQDDDPF
ncbi:MAG: hypothetical protein ACC628_04050 [Pirellulaceae bacterium]